MDRSIRINVLVLIFLLITTGVLLADESQPRVTIVFYETPLREALNEISLQTGVNIIPDYTVEGVVTADLNNVPLEKALEIILSGGGYTFYHKDNYYLVGLADPGSRNFGDLINTRIVDLENVSVSTVLSILPPHLKDYVYGNHKGDMLSISAPPTKMEKIINLIKRIDKPRKQIKITVVVSEVSTKELKKLGTGFLEYREKDNPSLNLKYDGSSLVLNGNIFENLLTRLEILQEEEKAKIHADPSIVVMDGEPAELFIGEKQTLFITEDEEIEYFKDIKVGISLKVTPRLISKDEMILDFSPSISHFVNSKLPEIAVRENTLDTTVRVASGQTAVIAGMTLQDDYNYKKSVPGLNKIPLLRWLFTKKVNDTGDRELLIFVTPTIK
ncbi:type II and III secretion system protein [Halothermothrix orenii]|uniref:Type II and III secretion system protein n=1 Tax=Halothermothrix orenii (strain H 168 / OCM 544 / DSM 9562) TaxID=373903 RepID=B8CXJ7_HALOH|nr:type II and III secretion system protein [Halothermothrix orenii]ACL70016.1 type II and III secretion system protein [Halothermothrix orenii H 168]